MLFMVFNVIDGDLVLMFLYCAQIPAVLTQSVCTIAQSITDSRG
jgi:hypothetical protein